MHRPIASKMKFFIIFGILIAIGKAGSQFEEYYNDYTTQRHFYVWHTPTSNYHEKTTENSDVETTTPYNEESEDNIEVLPLPFGDCDETKNLISLNLSYTGMTKINSEFIKNTQVNCLNFSKNNINFIAETFLENLPNLTVLNLGHNKINLENLNLNSNSKNLQLKTLILDNNPINIIKELIFNGCFNNLEILSIRQTLLNGLSSTCDLKNLKYLYLTDNYIYNEEDIFHGENYFKLSHLYVDNNIISTFNGTQFSNLELLQLDNNNIRILCNSHCNDVGGGLYLGKMTNLKHLFLAGDNIKIVLSDAFFDTIHLETLDLSRNYISKIANDTFKRLKFLKVLMLNSNRLTILPNFYECSKIEILNFNTNWLKNITSKQFFNLRSLKSLSLNNNKIKNIEKFAFTNLTSLNELDLSNNTLESLPENWIAPQNVLKILNVNGNYFTNFSQLNLHNAPNLEKIFLHDNPIENLNIMSFLHIENQSKSRLEEKKLEN
ncbi:leucine-rich repeat-containing protein 15-like [Leptopilina heterotoma]|uniref:leucine-rich repeat-containing protein 15-like n=1 Tax=Leptopilina heterotoma TaxID=63436 RepID=UPI001CA9F61F|nr:leucine-rich repeat-containing protein 15-like [Leptopilina heterotoma]